MAANPDHVREDRLADVMINIVGVVIVTGRSVTLRLPDDTVLHRPPQARVVVARLLSRATGIICSKPTRRSTLSVYMEQAADSVIR